jgi:hypothetical protein
MAIDKSAELARPTPKVDPQKLSKSELLLLKLSDEYEAASSADWDNNPPTSVKEALDRIAAALGPIT